MRTEEQFHQYFRKAQELAIRAHHNVRARQELLQLIDSERKKTGDNLTYERFLHGEQAFFNRNYPAALKQYLKAQAMPYFKLFCYRASAFVSKSKGELDKALNFAKQALNIYPYDYVTLSIYEELLTLDTQAEEAHHIRQRLRSLEAQHNAKSHPEMIVENDEEEVSFDRYATGASPMFVPSSFTVFPKEKEEHQEEIINAQEPYVEQKRVSQANVSHVIRPLSKSLPQGIDIATNPKKNIEEHIHKFSQQHQEHAKRYLDQYKSHRPCHNDCLYLLHGHRTTQSNDSQPLLLDRARRATGGYFIRWHNKGIVINPGTHFLNHFHQQGLHIRDIDVIIVTNGNFDSYADIKEIYELNYQVNKTANNPHTIHYYLASQAYQTLSTALKPHFKQERHSVHRLELFLDSPEGDKIDLTDNVILHYFPIGTPLKHTPARTGKEEGASTMPGQLGIKLDLHLKAAKDDKHHLSVGYISGAPWSAMLAHSLGSCDVLIAGFGNTSPNDYNKLKYNEDSLGYFGCYSLIEEVQPRLFICSEFHGNEGDIRLDVVKMMRQEYATAYPDTQQTPIVLPGDSNLLVELHSLHVFCSVTKEAVPADAIRVSKFAANFGTLQFLSPRCCS